MVDHQQQVRCTVNVHVQVFTLSSINRYSVLTVLSDIPVYMWQVSCDMWVLHFNRSEQIYAANLYTGYAFFKFIFRCTLLNAKSNSYNSLMKEKSLWRLWCSYRLCQMWLFEFTVCGLIGLKIKGINVLRQFHIDKLVVFLSGTEFV